jgi:hypothetical protein
MKVNFKWISNKIFLFSLSLSFSFSFFLSLSLSLSFLKVIGKMELKLVQENILGMMEEFIKVNFVKIKCQVWDN